jgi:hypothetical protein
MPAMAKTPAEVARSALPGDRRRIPDWAIPLGSQRHYGSTFFVVLSPGWTRSWKGKAMSDEEMARLPAIPSSTILAELKLREMPSRVFNVNR